MKNKRRRALLAVLWIAILALAWFSVDAWVAGFEPWLAARLAREVGRPVRIAGLGYRPLAGAHLARLEVEGLGAAEGIDIDLAGRRLLAGEIHLDAAVVDSASLLVARDTAGRWNLEGLFPNADPKAPSVFSRAVVTRLAIAVEAETPGLRTAEYEGALDVAPGGGGSYEAAWSGRAAAGGFAVRTEGRGSGGAETGISLAGRVSGEASLELGRLAAEGEFAVAFDRETDGVTLRTASARIARARLARDDLYSVSASDLELRVAPSGGTAFFLEGDGSLRPDLFEEAARIQIDARIDPATERIEIARLAVDADLARAEARGRIDPRALDLSIDLKEASIEKALALAARATGADPMGGIRATGVLDGSFRFVGPPAAPRLSAASWRIPHGRFSAEAGWLEVRSSEYRLVSWEPRVLAMEGRVAAGTGDTRLVDDAALAARLRVGDGFLNLESLALDDDAFRLRGDGTYGADYVSLRFDLSQVRIERAIPLARRVVSLPPALGGFGGAGGRFVVLRPRGADSFVINGSLQLEQTSLRLSEDPLVRLDGITGRVDVALRRRGETEIVVAGARTTGSRSTTLEIARLAVGPIEATGARLRAVLEGRELRVENGTFDLAGGRGEIAGLVSFREGRPVRTALLGRVKGLRFEDIYDQIQPFEGELTGPADAEFAFAMEGPALTHLHSRIRSTAGGRIGSRLLREFAEKLESGTTKMGLLGLSQFEYRNFRLDLDLVRDYYDRETARAKFEPPLSETIRDEILMEVGFDGPMPIWGPLHVDVDLKVVGMQLNLLLERIRKRSAPTPTAVPPPSSETGAGETPPASGGAPRSAPGPPR